MDVESLAKQLILQNMTPEQQKAVLDSVRATLTEARSNQKRRVSENVGMVVDALKKIEADIRAKYDDLGQKITDRVNSIRDGRDGAAGRDGRDGVDGRPGKDGAPGTTGPAGRDGRDGVDGKDGVSVTDAKIDFDGSLIISLSNGREINVGEVVAPDLAERIKVITNGGGTSQSVIDTLASLQQQINDLIPSQTANAGKFLTTDGTDLAWADVAGGLSYQGTWNAATNTPTLASSVGTNGYYYVVSVDGSTNLNGITDWKAGDWLIFNGTAWQKIDQSWAIAGANDNITSMTGLTGGISSPDFIQFDTGATNTTAVGKLYWDDGNGSLSLGLKGGNVDLQVGQENVVLVYNNSASTITPGQVVAVNGAQGQRPAVVLADADTEPLSAATLGVATESIAAGAEGFVATFGVVRGVDTSAFAAGNPIYLSQTAGGFTATRPSAPAHTVFLGWVVKVNASSGEIFLNISNGWELDELHNVLISGVASGNTLIYDASVGVWKNANLTDGTGITITEGAGSITITNSAPDQTVSLTGAGTTSITGTYPNFTVTSNDQYVGTVTSVGGTGTVNGISLSGTVTSSGSLTLGGTLSGVDLTTQVTGTLPIANGGTGQTTQTAAFDALSPLTTKGDLVVHNGTNDVRLPVGTNGQLLTADSTTAEGVKWAAAPVSTTIADDTTTNASYYPTFATATSGTFSTATVSSTKLVYNPSLGDLRATQLAASNGILFTNQTVSTSVTFPTGYEGISGKNTTVASGATVTVPSGATWTIV